MHNIASYISMFWSLYLPFYPVLRILGLVKDQETVAQNNLFLLVLGGQILCLVGSVLWLFSESKEKGIEYKGCFFFLIFFLNQCILRFMILSMYTHFLI